MDEIIEETDVVIDKDHDDDDEAEQEEDMDQDHDDSGGRVVTRARVVTMLKLSNHGIH